MAAGRRVRVVVVDDSRLMRSLLRRALEAEGDLETVGLAADVAEGRRLIRETDPDVVTLDVEMPGMNGLAFLEKIMTLRPTPVVMVSSLTAEGAETTLEALRIGAVDAVQKPNGPDPLGPFGEALRAKVRLAAGARVRRAAPRPPPARLAAAPRAAGRRRALVAVGASTGGVAAISELLEALPPALPPLVVAQHMPTGYTARFARRLRERLGRDVAEARDGEALTPGMIRIAPGDRHLEVVAEAGRLSTRLSEAAPVSGHRPSVDVLFASVARAVGPAAVGVILTGMGRDGAAWLRAMRAAGAACLGQSERTCVVYGMPRAARELGAVDEELDLDRLPARIEEAARGAPERRAVP
jgi:two-component system chemotaxis response regulator CheB